MILTKFDDFCTSLFEKIGSFMSWSTLIVLLVGILIGFVLATTIYGIYMLVCLKKEEKHRKVISKNTVTNEEIKAKIEEVKNKFVENTEGLTTKEKFEELGHSLFETMNVVAGTYFPESKYPLYELTIEELIMLLRYVSDRVEDMFSKPFLRPFKKMSVSQIFKFIDMRKKMNEKKIVKIVTNKKTHKIKDIVLGTLNLLNPIYWIRKIVMGTTLNTALRKACLIIIDIVGEETNKTYSKAIFDKERSIYQNEIDSEIENLGGEIENE